MLGWKNASRCENMAAGDAWLTLSESWKCNIKSCTITTKRNLVPDDNFDVNLLLCFLSDEKKINLITAYFAGFPRNRDSHHVVLLDFGLPFHPYGLHAAAFVSHEIQNPAGEKRSSSDEKSRPSMYLLAVTTIIIHDSLTLADCKNCCRSS